MVPKDTDFFTQGVTFHMPQDKGKSRGQDTIDENLKRVYQDALKEELPDRFHQLLNQLKAQDTTKPDHEGGGNK